MARICYNHPYINVAQKSVLAAGSTTVYQPDYKLGTEIKCDSGIYRYLQADGAISEGYVCKFLASGAATGLYDAWVLNTTGSGTAITTCGICVAHGGLADNQQGWFWLGEGEEYVYLASGVTSFTGPLCTWTTSGQVAAATSGDIIAELMPIDSTTSSGTSLRLCRSPRLLATNIYPVSTAA